MPTLLFAFGLFDARLLHTGSCVLVTDVSVVVPAHNRPKELLRTLRSLTRQTLPTTDFEVIVVDDGSREDARALVRKSAAALSSLNLQVVRNEKAVGASGARNQGARLAAAELLVFLDVDCLAHPDMLAVHLATQRERRVAASGYTHGRELTPETWELRIGGEWNWESAPEVFAKAATVGLLHDPLTELLAEPRSSDWAFFWTCNVSVPRDAFEAVGGFDEDFDVKGVEDVELGLRLSLAGLPTVFLPDSRALHQPHPRDRHTELLRDRRNDLVLLRRHPTLEVEAVCSFDIVNARAALPALTRFRDRLAPEAVDTAHLSALPRTTEALAGAETTLLIGAADAWPPSLPAPTLTVGPTADEVEGRSYRLLGTRLPFEDGQADVAVLTDYWRALPEATACRVIAEALRCARRVIVLSDAATAPPAVPDPELAAALEGAGSPFWTHTVALRREFHQFRFTALDRPAGGSNAAGASRAFTVEPAAWPLTHLSDITY
ncbi:glycosyltransferase [Streptomyces zhaozhouensis]|uniref:glycosyltransferase n=1 Tax=Streptomyces zhaozhouensis TaxID=1300267 RepID=UPI000BE431B6|nr:glycosyltransferase [Streptomyces zhaozhouensis]